MSSTGLACLAMLGRDQLEGLDADLCERARSEGALRLRLGQLLEALGRGGHHELGFSSLAAYSLERCGRSVRWVEGARCLARRLEALPEVRRALSFGLISWSKAERLSRLATAGRNTAEGATAEHATAEHATREHATREHEAEHEARWLVVARHLTVRQMRELLKLQLEGEANDGEASDAADAHRTLTLTVDREDSWLFEATRTLLAQLGTSAASDQVEALLAEGQESLLRAVPDGALDVERLERDDRAQRRWRDRLAYFREEAERRCEAQLPHRYPGFGNADADVGAGVAAAATSGGRQVGGPHAEQAEQAAGGGAALASMTPAALDAAVRELSRLLASHELELACHLLEFHRAEGWRRLGYATEAQYARERLGVSRASMLAKRALALRLRPLHRVTAAMASGQLGIEAAMQLAQVATPLTEAEWLERARQRTVKHLREEVAASLTAVRLSGGRDCPPPLPEEIERFFDLERAVVGGQLGNGLAANGRALSDAELASRCQSSGGAPGEAESSDPARRARRPWRAMLGSLGEWLAGGLGGAVQMSAARPLAGVGRVRLRLRVASELADWWRGLEAQARRWLPRGMSWVRFVCLSVWRGWQHLLGVAVAYGGIYVRDRFRCTSPVCNRRDVTPHHLRYRSAGGGDEPENLAAVCSGCHLLGIHEQRIRAVGRAGRVRWELGRGQPCLVVEGRDRLTS